MRPDEIAIAADWAAAEGWNPGLSDAACFATIDPDGFLIGELDGQPAATISCVNYDARFAFLGFYIVRGDLRGRGFGLRIWNAAIAHAGARVIGLDGVVAQQDNYKKSGFALAYANVRYGGTIESPRWPLASLASAARADEPGYGRVSGARTIESRADEPGYGRVSGARAIESGADEPGSGRASGARTVESPRWPLASLASAAAAGVVALSEVPFVALEADDASVFPAPRPAFLRCWIGAPGQVGRALLRDGKLAAWGVIRPCRVGYKIGPLVADDRAGAEAVLAALVAGVGGGEIFLDV
ncbi:MAG TPA: GNAT family N-acetyltransferase, partial [Xanthobacteraceae bacterium]